jgi:hypothetical protein
MNYVIRKLEYSDTETWVPLPAGTRFRINPDQVVIWVRVVPILEPVTDQTPRFPALQDTGHGHNFSITEEQICDRAKIDRGSLDKLGSMLINAVETPLHRAGVWVYRNQRGKCADIRGASQCQRRRSMN